MATIADGAVLLDAEMNVVVANPTARKVLGWTNREEEIIGANVLNYLPQSVKAELTRPLYKIATGRFQKEYQDKEGAEFRITMAEPVHRMIRVLLTTVLDQSKENLKGIAITIQDITREVELNEAKSQFISNVSHELRTPLFNIKSFIETLHEYGEDLTETERKEFLETANRETDRLTRLVNDVLDLSRLESNKRYQFDAVDLGQPIEQTLRTYQLNAKEQGIELQYEIEPDLPFVLGNYDLLLQVFTNLVGNSLKFTESGGFVMIRAYRLEASAHHSHHHVRVEVSDTGIGIDDDDQHAIFDRFFRVENRVHTLEGTGLGLSIVRNIIEKHHSTVHLISEVGIGTTFWFDLATYKPEAPSFEALLSQNHSPASHGSDQASHLEPERGLERGVRGDRPLHHQPSGLITVIGNSIETPVDTH